MSNTSSFTSNLVSNTWSRKLTMEDLVWMGSDVKTMFNDNRFWPSFVGAKIQGDKETERGALPVLLWPEQREYLDQIGGIGITDAAATRSSLLGQKNKNIGGNINGKGNGNRSRGIKGVKSKKRMREGDGDGKDGDQELHTHTSSSSLQSIVSPYTCGSTYNGASDKPEVRGYMNPAKRRRGLLGFGGGSNSSYSFFGAISSFAASAALFIRSAVVAVGFSAWVPPSRALSHAEQRAAVFSDLQREGFFIGPADVYGGDYNIYKGNPTNSHSMATIRVVYNGKMTARDMLAFSRVQNQVAKSAVFAFVSTGGSREVKYSVVNFQAVSDRM